MCLETGVCFINAIPVFIASSPKRSKRSVVKVSHVQEMTATPVKIGATVLHKTLAKLFVDMGSEHRLDISIEHWW